MKNKFFNFSLLIIFVFFSFFSYFPPVEARSSVVCSVNASVDGHIVSISGHVDENGPELDASYTTVYIHDSAGAGSEAGTGQEGASVNYTATLPAGSYTAYIEGTGQTNPGGATSTCSNVTNFTVIDDTAENGSCSSSHYDCSTGTSGSQNSGVNSWTWTCYGSGGGSDASCSEAKTTPTVTISASPSSIVSGNLSNLTWSSTNVTDCYASGGWTGGQPTSGTTPVYPTQTTTYRIDCSSVASGSTWAQTTVTVSASAMSGTLTPASQGCTLASGATTCNATLSWTTDNPVATSAVTNNGGATPASSSGNTGNNVVFAVPYYSAMSGVTTFYLYNNAQQLALATVTVCDTATPWNGATCGTNNYPAGSHDYANCTDAGGWAIDWDSANSPLQIQFFDGPAGGGKVPVGYATANINRPDLNPGEGISKEHGFVWTIPNSLKDNAAHTIYAYALDYQDSSHSTLLDSNRTITCTPPAMSGTLTVPDCTIQRNEASCTTTATWSVTNPESATTQVTSGYPSAGTVVGSGHSGSAVVTIPYNSRDLYLYNNAKLLASDIVSANCVSGSSWDGAKCASIYPAFSVDLTLNGGDYATEKKALQVLLGEQLTLAWTSAGNNSKTCAKEDGFNWEDDSASASGTTTLAAPTTLGVLKYTFKCTQDSGQGALENKSPFAIFDFIKRALAAPLVTETDQSWVDVGIVVVRGQHVIWKCEPAATESIGTFTTSAGSGTFNTDIDGNGNGRGDLAGDVIVNPIVTTDYNVECNNGSGGTARMSVPKKPIFKEN